MPRALPDLEPDRNGKKNSKFVKLPASGTSYNVQLTAILLLLSFLQLILGPILIISEN